MTASNDQTLYILVSRGRVVGKTTDVEVVRRWAKRSALERASPDPADIEPIIGSVAAAAYDHALFSKRAKRRPLPGAERSWPRSPKKLGRGRPPAKRWGTDRETRRPRRRRR